MTASPLVSVVISSNGRCTSLAKTLHALRWQRYREFEVCVVCGPARDGTHELIAEAVAAGHLKSAVCDTPNLSQSRNIGIGIAAGTHIAFIDDDALPEPVWLEQLLHGFDDPAVAGVGGLVFAPDARTAQFRYSTCDRFGNARHGLDQPADAGAFPLSAHFPHVMGTNAAFRRDALIAIGGFDEEYEYYLDEADVCCRLVDAGYAIRQRRDAPVHHKFLSGTVRDGEGITVRRYPVVKNQLYFSLVNGRRHASLPEIIKQSMAFAGRHRSELEQHVERGALHPRALADFDADWERALERALSRGLAGRRRIRPADDLRAESRFVRYPTNDQAGERRRTGHVAIVLPSGPPDASTLAAARDCALKHGKDARMTRVFIPSGGGDPTADGVDLIGNVWLHRVGAGECPVLQTLPPEAWKAEHYRRCLHFAIERVAAYDPFDALIDRSGYDLRHTDALNPDRIDLAHCSVYDNSR
ncbi:MAG: glycosyltransferase family 2 protein [Hyphomicrobiaceae bacterium]